MVDVEIGEQQPDVGKAHVGAPQHADQSGLAELTGLISAMPVPRIYLGRPEQADVVIDPQCLRR